MKLYDNLFGIDSSKERYYGILTALVKENWNEEKKGMIKVELFLGEQGKGQTAWIPVAAPYTGNKAGAYFLPEVDNEVLVAFINGNPDEPVVIGSLWNSVTPIGDDFACENNNLKTIKTRAGHQIIFDEEEEKGQITIQTAGKLRIDLEDEKKQVTLTGGEAKSSIAIAFEEGKVAIQGEKKMVFSIGEKEVMTIDSQGIGIKCDAIKLEAGQELTLKGQSMNLSGNSLKVKSDAALEIKAGATLKMEGSAMSELKGGMVKIN